MSTDASGFDQYQRIQIQGVSSADDSTPTNIHVDPTTNELLTKLTTPDGDSVMDDTNDSVKVTITADSAGIGGGTQYTEGDTDASITGNVVLFESNTTTSAVSTVSADNPLPVSVTGGGDATAANQTTIIGHVDGIETLLGTIDADTSSIATDSSTIAGDTTSIDTKTPALGQALAASSVPVVLPATQITTLTPQTDALTDTQLRATPVPVSGSLTVDLGANNDVTVTSGTVTANLGATDNAVLDDIAAKLGTIDADTSALFGTVSGTEVQVDVVASLPAGTNAIGKLTANSGVDIGDVTINNASGDAVYVRTDQNGLTSERVSNTDGASTAFSNFGATASTYNYIRAITVYNSSATDGYVDFRDGTAGSVLWTMPLPAGGGATLALDAPLFRTSANTALAYDVSGALSTVYISISGYRSTT